MSRYPLRAAHGNVVFDHLGRRGAIYRLDMVNELAPVAERKRTWKALAQAVTELKTGLMVMRPQRTYPANEYAEGTRGFVDPRHADPDDWMAFQRAVQDEIAHRHVSQPECYVLALLPLTGAQGRVAARRGRSITARELDQTFRLEQGTARKLLGGLAGDRITPRELQWLQARAAYRGLGEPPLDPHWQPTGYLLKDDGDERERRPAWQPLGSELARFGKTTLQPFPRYVEVTAPDGRRTLQAVLTLGAMADRMQFPGRAEVLSRPLERIDHPIDAVMHVEYVPNATAIDKVRRRVQAADSAAQEEAEGEHGVVSYTTQENKELARELLAYLESDAHPPLLLVVMRLVVSVPVPRVRRKKGERRRDVARRQAEARELAVEKLDDLCDSIDEEYGSTHVARLVGEQRDLWWDCLPRLDGGTVKTGRDVFTVEQLAATSPMVSNFTGTRGGPYVAKTINGNRPIRMDPGEAAQNDEAPAIAIGGRSGAGKTMTLEWLLYQLINAGWIGFDLDPKPDHHLEQLPELAGKVRVIDLTLGREYAGWLDPLNIMQGDLGEDLATNYDLRLIPEPKAEWNTEIRLAVREAIAKGLTNRAVIEILMASGMPEARSAGRALGTEAETPLGRLGFAEERDQSGSFVATHPLTTVKAHALDLPDVSLDRRGWVDTERRSVATMDLLLAWGMQLMRLEQTIRKYLSCDEAWWWFASSTGRKLLHRAAFMGRERNMALIIALQQLAGIKDLAELVGTAFLLGQKTEADARVALEWANLDPTPARIEMQRSYRRGRGIIVNHEGQRAEAQVDLIFEHLLRVLNTRPGKHQQAEAERVTA
jgi:hypothetical protein